MATAQFDLLSFRTLIGLLRAVRREVHDQARAAGRGAGPANATLHAFASDVSGAHRIFSRTRRAAISAVWNYGFGKFLQRHPLALPPIPGIDVTMNAVIRQRVEAAALARRQLHDVDFRFL